MLRSERDEVRVGDRRGEGKGWRKGREGGRERGDARVAAQLAPPSLGTPEQLVCYGGLPDSRARGLRWLRGGVGEEGVGLRG